MNKVFLKEYIKAFLNRNIILENKKQRAIDSQSIKDAFPENKISNELNQNKGESLEEIVWGDLIDVLKANIKSKKTIKRAKFMFKIIGASTIESGIELSSDIVSQSFSIVQDISQTFFKSVAEEAGSSLSLDKINKKLKSKFKKPEKILANILLRIYCSETNSELIQNLTIDEEVSKIIDDEVELGFLEWLSNAIINDSKVRNRKIKEANINTILSEYLEITYNERTIKGYDNV